MVCFRLKVERLGTSLYLAGWWRIVAPNLRGGSTHRCVSPQVIFEDDGDRTRDLRNHNPLLYHLSYVLAKSVHTVSLFTFAVKSPWLWFVDKGLRLGSLLVEEGADRLDQLLVGGLTILAEGNGLLGARTQILESEDSTVHLSLAEDDGAGHTDPFGVPELSSEACLTADVDRDATARRPQRRRDALVLGAELVSEVQHQHLGHGAHLLELAQLQQSIDQSIDSNRSSRCRQLAIAESADQPIEASTGVHASDLGHLEECRLEHGPGVVAQSARDGQIDDREGVEQTDRLERLADHPELCQALLSHIDACEDLAELGESPHRVICSDVEEAGEEIHLRIREADELDGFLSRPLSNDPKFIEYRISPHLVELVDDAQHRDDELLAETYQLGQAVEELAVVEAHEEVAFHQIELEHHVAHDVDDLGVRERTLCSDDVGVELCELTVAALLDLRGLAPHDMAVLPPFERHRQIRVGRHHARQGHRQVVAKSHLLSGGQARVCDVGTPELHVEVIWVARQDVQPLDDRCLEWIESVALVHAANRVDDRQAGDLLLGEEVDHSRRLRR